MVCVHRPASPPPPSREGHRDRKWGRSSFCPCGPRTRVLSGLFLTGMPTAPPPPAAQSFLCAASCSVHVCIITANLTCRPAEHAKERTGCAQRRSWHASVRVGLSDGFVCPGGAGACAATSRGIMNSQRLQFECIYRKLMAFKHHSSIALLSVDICNKSSFCPQISSPRHGNEKFQAAGSERQENAHVRRSEDRKSHTDSRFDLTVAPFLPLPPKAGHRANCSYSVLFIPRRKAVPPER